MLRSRQLLSVLSTVRKINGAAFSDVVTPVDTTYMEIPVYNIDKPQTLEKRKARSMYRIDGSFEPPGDLCRKIEGLHYQSRKRGMLENDLLLSTFAKKYLDSFNEQQTIMYDRLINSPSNDWDIFYWIVQKKETPKEFDNEIMDLLKKHAKNEEKVALSQPDLY